MTPSDIIIVGVILAAIASAVVVLCFILFQKGRDSQHSRMMGYSISSQGRLVPFNDPNAKLKIEDLRRKFDEGVAKFRAAGKNLYSLPWYLVVGEPGSGKTEAIRHSGIGFPPGLQDELQGTGGTINMNWWFTNRAVMLDTAGRLLFEEVRPSASNEWLEFLRLLRKNRPECPVNGMILVIPADSLIRDSHDDLMRKARKIATQLNDIQRELDIRFPVFVLITKSDLILGFREFFEHIKNPDLEGQILGWSNPAELDAPFNPSDLENYLRGFIADIEKRRTALLAGTLDGSIDRESAFAFYPFGESLKNAIPNLRKYLETIFVQGEWSRNPLFLRGIYFTSSMQEGEALDKELASALGISVDELPGGRSWERDKSYFLKDVYLEKIFKEQGLVVRATNVKALMQKRRLALFSAATIAPMAVLLAAWFANKDFEKSIGNQYAYWVEIAKGKHWKDEYWVPRIISKRKDGYSNNKDSPVAIGKGEISLYDLHSKMAEFKDREIKIPSLFSSYKSEMTANRANAQRIFYEAGVLLPIVNAAKEKTEKLEKWDGNAKLAFSAFLKIDGDSVRIAHGDIANIRQTSAAVDELMRFTCLAADSSMSRLFAQTYTDPSKWEPSKFGGGTEFSRNEEIVKLWDLYQGSLSEKFEAVEKSVSAMESVFSDLKELNNQYFSLLEDSLALLGNIDAAKVLSRRMSKLKSLSESIYDKIGRDENWSFEKRYAELSEKLEKEISAEILDLKRLIPADLVTFGLNDRAVSLFADIDSKLSKNLDCAKGLLRKRVDSGELGRMFAFDALWFAKMPNGLPRYMAYNKVLVEAEKYCADIGKLPDAKSGGLAAALAKIDSEGNALVSEVMKFPDPESAAFKQTIRELESSVKAWKKIAVAKKYCAEVEQSLRDKIGFPVLLDSEKTMSSADIALLAEEISAIEKEIKDSSDKVDNYKFSSIFDGLLANLESIADSANSFVRNGNAVKCRIGLLGFRGENEEFERRFSSSDAVVPANRKWTSIALSFDGSNGEISRTRDVATLAAFPIDSSLLKFSFYKTSSDADLNKADKISELKSPWIALRWILAPSAREIEKGRRYRIVFNISDGGATYRQAVEIVFDTPIPDAENWLTSSKIRRGR